MEFFDPERLVAKWNPASATARLAVSEITDMLIAVGTLTGHHKTYKNVKIKPEFFNTIKDYFEASRVIVDDNENNSLLGISGKFPDEKYLCVGLNFEAVAGQDNDSHYRLFALGTDAEVDAFISFVKPFRAIKRPQIEWVTSVSNGIQSSNIAVPPPKPIDVSFYPCLGGTSVEEFVKKFKASDSTVLLLIGEPGTGKSELINHIIWAADAQCMLTFSDQVTSSDTLFSHFIESDCNVLLVEDADEMLGKRTHGNPDMKRILNISSGLTARRDKKFIFSTNLPSLASVDEALVRPGRCFATLEFKKYTREQAELVAQFIEIDLPSDKEFWTLAEVFSVKNGENHNHQVGVETQKVGFA